MKKFFTMMTMVLAVAVAIAQAPEKFSYQAVVRNASNALVINAPVGVRVSILQGSATGNAVYVETQTATTNANGLLTLEIGDGNVQQGSFANIDWGNGPFFLKTETDPAGSTNYSITTTQQLLSVPYALYAKNAGNGFSGDYNDLTNTPEIPTVPANVSAFTNDAGYLTGYTETDPQFNAWDKDYNDLINKPTIPTVPTNISAFTNDAGYLTNYTETDPQFNAWDKDYNDLINKPTIPTVPTNVSAFSNDAGYITAQDIPAIPTVPTNVGAFTNDAGYLTNYTETDPQFNAWDKDYNDLTNKPTIPTVPTNVSVFTNDAGYLTSYTETDPNVPAWAKEATKPVYDYTEITNTPEIPTVPTNVSAFTNDAGYITMDSVPAIPTAVSAFTNDAGYLTSFTETDPNVPAWAKEATKPAYDYSEITNTPEIPVVPTNVSAFTNDAGYLTSFTEQQVLSISHDTIFLSGGSFVVLPPTAVGFSGDYNDLINKPTIPSVPQNVSTFTNDAGYITAQDIPAIPTVPTNVSAFTNDAGYITDYTESDPTIYSWAKAAVKPTYSYSEILNTPTLFDGNYNSLTNKPNLATVATTGNYNDLSNKPSIPAAANDATLTITRNGSSVGTFTANASSNKSIDISVPTTTSELINNSGFITNAALPTNVSQLNNDAGYITAAQCSDVDFCYLADLVNALQQQVADLQAQLDSMGLIVDTAITHMGFHCGISTVTDYDGNIYNTVQIGEQCWMKENLRTTHYPNGAEIPLGSTPSNTESFRYNPNNDANTVNTYGYLYNWSAVMHGATSSNSNPSGVQGLCPAGWHVPSDAEWTQLTNYVSCQSEYVCGTNSSFIAKALAATIGWTTDTTYCAVGNDPTTNNATGFTAIPAGYCWGYYGLLTYQQYGSHAFYSSSTQSNSSRAYGRFLKYDLADVVVDYNDNKFCGLSVRCVLGEGTAAEIPTVTTSAVTNITENTATCSGEVIADGNTNVTSRGVCWSTSPNPTVSDNHTTDGGGMGSFTSSLTGLEVGILYYVRAYATNSAGTAYGEEIKFSIPSVNETMPCSSNPTVIDYDGNVYNTVQIGAQCWMKENLRTTYYPNGAEVSELHCPNNDAGNVNTYGYLYRWDAMMHGASSTSDNPSGVQGVCPAGWHVPSDAEWMQLTDYLRGQSVYVCGSDNNNIAKSLAASTDWNTDTSDCTVGNNLTANNATGFGALPAGYTLLSSSYNFGNNARYWSSTFKSENHAFYCNFSSDNSNVERASISIGWAAFSVRCLRD